MNSCNRARLQQRLFRWCGGLGLCICLHPLTALEWKAGNGYRSAELPVPKSGKTGFTQLSGAQTGISFTNYLSDEKAAENQIRLVGSGMALGDVDGDGWG